MANGDAPVFTTKELLTRIDEKVDKINDKLDQKADRSRVHELAADVSGIQILLGSYPTVLLELQDLKERVDALRLWKAGVLGGFACLLALGSALHGPYFH